MNKTAYPQPSAFNDRDACHPRALFILLLASMLFAPFSKAQETTPTSAIAQTPSTDQPQPTHRLVLVTGAPGEPVYGEQFSKWAEQWQQVAKDADWQWRRINGNHSADNDLLALKQEIDTWGQTDIDPTKPRSSDNMTYILVMIGHGTAQAGEAKFNLQGPDLSARELAQWLAAVDAPVIIVNCASGSSPFINALSGKNRVVVTATQNEQESNFCRFGEYLPQALLDVTSDLDHDDQVSLVEAVIQAANRTRAFYESEDRIQTEHALLDDNADKLGSPAEALSAVMRGQTPAIKSSAETVARQWDGMAAARVVFPNVSRSLVLSTDQEQVRAELENELVQLRQQKATLAEATYYERLEQTLVKLAQLYEEVDNQQEKEAKSP